MATTHSSSGKKGAGKIQNLSRMMIEDESWNSTILTQQNLYKLCIIFLLSITSKKDKDFDHLFPNSSLRKSLLFRLLLSIYSYPRRVKEKHIILSGLCFHSVSKGVSILLKHGLIQQFNRKRLCHFNNQTKTIIDKALMITKYGERILLEMIDKLK